MDTTTEPQKKRPAEDLIDLLTSIDAHAARTNALLYAMLHREQRQAFDAAFPADGAAGEP